MDMNLSGNTILITGGSSGIGLELSKQLLKKNNKIIICGSSKEKLRKVKLEFPEIETINCDLMNKTERQSFIDQIRRNFPELNVLINNAARVNKIDFLKTANSIELAENELSINFLAPIHLTKGLFPLLNENQNSQIVNITTGLVYVPRTDYPFYCPTKSALHSFTQILRKQIENDSVAVTEVMFPAVNTPWHNGSPPKIAIGPEKAVEEMLKGLWNNKSEIRVGRSKILYIISRIFPKFAFNLVNNLSN